MDRIDEKIKKLMKRIYESDDNYLNVDASLKEMAHWAIKESLPKEYTTYQINRYDRACQGELNGFNNCLRIIINNARNAGIEIN